jgi:hypothetical protein
VDFHGSALVLSIILTGSTEHIQGKVKRRATKLGRAQPQMMSSSGRAGAERAKRLALRARSRATGSLKDNGLALRARTATIS